MRRQRILIFILLTIAFCLILYFPFLERWDVQVWRPNQTISLAIAVKTGKDIIHERLPVQLDTFLSDVGNVMIFGDSSNVTIRNHKMINAFNQEISKRDHEEIVPNETSFGWISDAHKNLPGFRELYKQYPSVDWYIMIDDDTFVFMENLKSALSWYNPEKELYLGLRHSFTGCDGITEIGKGPDFGHGGSGIILSRGAMKSMLQILDSCIVKYRDCWAGDIRVALCLRDAGILLKGLRGLNQSPPNHRAYFTDPCEKPITYHHIPPEITKDLYELEHLIQSNGNRIKLEDIVNQFYDASIVKAYNRPGGDFKTMTSKDAIECKKLCRDNPQCVSFTFTDNTCYLKKDIPSDSEADDHWSGVFAYKFKCNSWFQ